jgi:type II secretory ATPase GspE/PulE/Tfp pilus assembly ATPase PilB-like protein
LSREEKIKKGIDNDPIVLLVDSLLYKAIQCAASDIHLEQNQDNMRVRFRIDGILYDQDPIDFEQKLPVLSRLKILSALDIAEKRVPQDGKIRVSVKKKDAEHVIDLRISTFPSIYGEKMVVRILDRSLNCIRIDSLGFSAENLQTLYGLIKRPNGFFLVTGPTGSGKTTTLYAILSHLNDASCNIVTMEDPVEYNLDGITQSQINTKAGFNFENGLRSMLRQDPDVLMVGEIRDKQTAQIAIEASLTGHLVFSTLHTNDSAGAITRLIDMGVEPFLINAALSGVLAQRLVRKLCNSCKKAIDFDSGSCQAIKNKNLKKIFVSQGCRECMNLGYKGRTGIFELLVIKDNIRDLVLKKSSIQEIQNQAVKNGMNFLFDDGLRKVEQGEISLEELLRVVGE